MHPESARPSIRILAVCGSLQAESGNLALLRRAAELAPDTVRVELFDGLRDLPLFNPDLEAAGVPPAVAAWRAALAAADAVLIASPEYGHSLTGVLKNAIDWTIGSGELYRKAVAVTAAVAGPERGRRGLDALRQTLLAMEVAVAGGRPIVRGPDADRELTALLGELAARIPAGR